MNNDDGSEHGWWIQGLTLVLFVFPDETSPGCKTSVHFTDFYRFWAPTFQTLRSVRSCSWTPERDRVLWVSLGLVKLFTIFTRPPYPTKCKQRLGRFRANLRNVIVKNTQGHLELFADFMMTIFRQIISTGKMLNSNCDGVSCISFFSFFFF